ncbi:hypothetical protein [uncultured Corynebacterium sp.]|uniref:hypothetical protein n=1 Tax=uncultured Corynebacterium sp. TaxID=159447 RepID=UPI0025EB2331|nr:hypothetical protein [uncultured Corynebacterium sp.]
MVRSTVHRTSKGRRRAIVAAVAATASMFAVACADTGNSGDVGVEKPLDTSWEIRGSMNEELADEVADIAEEYEGEAAVALAVPGATSDDGPVSAGELSDVAAWSTSKIPVAVAGVKESEWATDLVDPMITESDNLSAEMMWISLGDAGMAAQAVNDVLVEGGDVETEFEAWTAPGDTQWELTDQAAFGANLPCIEGVDPVLEAMGDIVGYQSYGLGEIDGARFKGGWGPDELGGYTSRQFGTIPADGGVVGVAIAARPGDATDETGREMLDALAESIAAHTPRGGACQNTPPETSGKAGAGTSGSGEETSDEATSDQETSDEATSEKPEKSEKSGKSGNSPAGESPSEEDSAEESSTKKTSSEKTSREKTSPEKTSLEKTSPTKSMREDPDESN